MDENVKAAVQCAARSLARTEQCRASLERKLLQKEFERDAVQGALDYLEEKHYLDDARYASSWVRTHCAVREYGRLRLLRELVMRGVKKNVAENAIEDYFSTQSEEELCARAYNRFLNQKKDAQKIMKSLADRGFSYNMIQSIFKEEGERYATE